ncbi:MAG: hypothetical protein ACI8TF_001281 [Paracoccaceae bacterium]|jgi:hypothetical protein
MQNASCSRKNLLREGDQGAFDTFGDHLAKALRIQVVCLMSHSSVVAMSWKHPVIKTHDLAP